MQYNLDLLDRQASAICSTRTITSLFKKNKSTMLLPCPQTLTPPLAAEKSCFLSSFGYVRISVFDNLPRFMCVCVSHLPFLSSVFQTFWREPWQRKGLTYPAKVRNLILLSFSLGEICGFKIHDQDVPFEAVVVDKSTGEGVIRSTQKLDCELQKDYTFTIQAYDCGKGPEGSSAKKSHK